MLKTINAQFLTTINLKIFLRTLFLLTFWLSKLRYWKDTEKLEELFLEKIWKKESKIISFYNARSSIFHSLKILDLKETDEVIVSWFTCVSVVNAVLQTGVKIKYCDIEKESLNMDLWILKSLINDDTKAIIIQHTFWNYCDFSEISKIAKERNIYIIEDSAHLIDCRDKKSFVSTTITTNSDFTIYSTWRDKVISSVTGGFLVIHNKEFFSKISEIKKKLRPVSKILALKNLFYNLVAYKSYLFYNIFGLWKIIMHLSVKLNLIPKILEKKEKECNSEDFYYMLPNSLAYLWKKELKILEKQNSHRLELAKIYKQNFDKDNFWIIKKQVFSEWIPFGYAILLEENFKELYNFLKIHHIYLWIFWSWINIAPNWTDLANCKYELWTCKVAEEVSKKLIIFPNHYQTTEKDLDLIFKVLEKFE